MCDRVYTNQHDLGTRVEGTDVAPCDFHDNGTTGGTIESAN